MVNIEVSERPKIYFSCSISFVCLGQVSPAHLKKKQQKREQKKESKVRDDTPRKITQYDFDDWVWKKLPLLASVVIQVAEQWQQIPLLS